MLESHRAKLRARAARLKSAAGGIVRRLLLPGDLSAVRAGLEGHTAWLKSIEQGLADLNVAHSAQLRDLSRWQTATVAAVSSLSSMPVLPSPVLQAGAPPPRLVDERVALARASRCGRYPAGWKPRHASRRR